MNILQREAFNEGIHAVQAAFQNQQAIDLQTINSWLNSCLAVDRTIVKKHLIHQRDEEGNLTATSSIEINRAEVCGYRITGAFNALESIRQKLAQGGTTFSFGNPHE